jgi:flavin reductase (DIM6/NTAB) family NADH-FMN oxidoreductase RutF
MHDSDPHKRLAAALGRIPSGLFILTVRQQTAETGMLVSWVQQCSFSPPLVSVAMQRGREVLAWLGAGATFTLNVLDATQTDMIVHFGKGFPLDKPAFEGLDIERSEAGNPVLSEALAYLDCRVQGRCSAGDHELVLAEIVAGKVLGDGQPMVHVRKSGSHY